MKVCKTLGDLDLSKDSHSSASRLLEIIVSGKNEVLESPMCKEIGAQKILDGWDLISSSNDNSSKLNSILLDIELSNRSKFGPRSIAKPWVERRESVISYYKIGKTAKVLSNPTDQLTPRLRPLSLDSSINYLKSTTNSGLPFLVKKRNVKAGLLTNFQSLLDREDPCILFTRTQENDKTRNVWGYPIADTLVEMSVYQPLLSYQRKLPWRAALRKAEDVDLGITKLLTTSQLLDQYNISLDAGEWDASIKPDNQAYYFKYVKSLFQNTSHDIIERQQFRFGNIGLLTPDGVYCGPHGIPSGSTHTNECGSVVQRGIAMEFSPLSAINCQVQGDDGAYSVKYPEQFLNHFKDYGIKINDEKSYISKDFIIYLQNLYHLDYMNNSTKLVHGIYPTYRALLRICYLERFEDFSEDEISGKDYFAIRTIMILENCKHHPLFQELVRYIYNLDKYKLNVSDEGLDNFVKRKFKQDGKDVSFTSNQYGDNVKGLKDFETVKLIRSFSV